MAVSPPALFPLTLQDEQEQLEFAIMLSLEENYSPTTSVQDIPGTSDPNHHVTSDPIPVSTAANSVGMEEPSTSNHATSSPIAIATNSSNDRGRKGARKRVVPAPYRRSRTMPNCSDTSHCGSPNKPTLTLNPVRARSVDYSPPRPTYSTDCCEVRDEIILENKVYLENLTRECSSNVNPPLHIAVKKDHFDCLDGIIGAIPYLVMSRDSNEQTPLFVAVTEENTRMARRLVAAGANVDVGRKLETPLLAAIENENRELVRLLLRHGANPNQGMNRGWTALHECVYRGNSELLELVINYGGDPNVRDVFGVSPVFTSAACGRNECLDVLLRSGGDPNLCSASKAASPLYEACKETHIDCAITLLKHGADPHITNCEGLYPIHMACVKGSIELVEELLKVTEKSLVENCGMSPIHSAAKEDEIEILELLIDHGYDVNIKITKDKIAYRDRRQTALFFAVYNDSEEATELLLKAGAKTDLDYVKPLLVAESHHQYKLVDMLIDHGADINASFAEEGVLFPATAAFAMKDPRMLRKILLAGCDVTKCFKCPFGENDHSIYSQEEQKKSFCHFLTQDHNAGWAEWAVHRLLDFVDQVDLCKRLKDNIKDSDEWGEIREAIGNPRRLTHLCRLRIRKVSRKLEFEARDLPLPKSLLNYLNHVAL